MKEEIKMKTHTEEAAQQNQNVSEQATSFVSERIKRKPVNKGRLFRRTSYIVISAIVFGIIACITFLVLEPIISNMLYPEEIQKVSIPDVQEEVSPDELLTEKEAEEEMTEAARVAAEEAAQSAIENAQAKNEVKPSVETFATYYEELYGVAEESSKSIVKVTGVSTDMDWFQVEVENENSVAGILIADNGTDVLIVADAAHLKDFDSYSITFSNEVIADAELRSYDSNTGLGIFAVKYTDIDDKTRQGIIYATLGKLKKNEAVGKLVIAIGSPMGDYGSVSYGAINSEGTTIKLADATYGIISTDIYGNSQASGALINTNGEIVGIITASSMAIGNSQLVSAISVKDIHMMIEKLSNNEALAYSGIYSMNVTEMAHNELGIPYGAYVSDVDMGSPAMNAGIAKGDVIVRVDDVEISSYNDYNDAILSRKPGNIMWVTVARYGGAQYKEITCEVTTTERDSTDQQ